ncbi:MAG: hypothetical protein ABI415_03390 [Flavitalea sp.]
MKKVFIITALFYFISQPGAFAQGCVAIRSTGASCSMEHPDLIGSKWEVNANYRYFKSFRHYSGKEEQKQRQVLHNDVRNYSNSLDFSISRIISSRLTLSLNVPFVYTTRSSLYEHGLVNGHYVKQERRNTSAHGLGDMRISAYYWLLDPVKHMNGNIQAGLGLKLPTGNYDYKDLWYNVGANGGPELRTVDQSIQPGDGGTGFTTEVNGYYNFSHHFGAYGNGFYLFNPRNMNGTRTYRETLSASLYNETIMSVSDQYMGRAGFSYMTEKLGFSLGGRIDGIPVHDLIGKSDGFRRPGYAIAVEPGLNFSTHKIHWYLNVPIAVSRNRTQSVTDKQRTVASGTYQIGDAAFADYVINVGATFKF